MFASKTPNHNKKNKEIPSDKGLILHLNSMNCNGTTHHNAYIIYCQLNQKCPMIFFRRMVTESLLTLARPPKVGRPALAMLSPNINRRPAKRLKSDYSVDASVRSVNRGCHWPVFSDKRGKCEACSKNKIESEPHFKCSMRNVFLCLDEKKRKLFQSVS